MFCVILLFRVWGSCGFCVRLLFRGAGLMELWVNGIALYTLCWVFTKSSKKTEEGVTLEKFHCIPCPQVVTEASIFATLTLVFKNEISVTETHWKNIYLYKYPAMCVQGQSA